MSLILVFNKNSPRAHTELELDMLGVHGKLVKYVIHLSKRKNWKKITFLHTSCPNSNEPVFGLKEFQGLSSSIISPMSHLRKTTYHHQTQQSCSYHLHFGHLRRDIKGVMVYCLFHNLQFRQCNFCCICFWPNEKKILLS